MTLCRYKTKRFASFIFYLYKVFLSFDLFPSAASECNSVLLNFQNVQLEHGRLAMQIDKRDFPQIIRVFWRCSADGAHQTMLKYKFRKKIWLTGPCNLEGKTSKFEILFKKILLHETCDRMLRIKHKDMGQMADFIFWHVKYSCFG